MTPKQLARIAKALSGKTIARIDMRPFDTGYGSHGADPYVEFTDGTVLQFTMVDAIEDEDGMVRQGVVPRLTPSRRARRVR